MLENLFGGAVDGLSPASVTRLTQKWQYEYHEWNRRDLSGEEFTYVWVDGIHFNVRFGENKLCTLVVIGATKDGQKKLLAVEGGYRESGESWSVLLRSLRCRGLAPPKFFIGDGALGFWNAVKDVYPESKCQLCWVHKIANVLDKLPKSLQRKAKGLLHEIYKAENKFKAMKAYNAFVSIFEPKYPRATASLSNNLDSLLTFYDYPAEHWRHIRTTNPIESTFATVRLRTYSTRGHGSMESTLALAFKLVMEASKGWRRLNGSNLINKLYDPTVTFKDGIEEKRRESRRLKCEIKGGGSANLRAFPRMLT